MIGDEGSWHSLVNKVRVVGRLGLLGRVEVMHGVQSIVNSGL
jgi:hypothetical protein